MSSDKYLFVTGAARSGSTLLAQILNTHPHIHLASDPYLPLFRIFRNAILESKFEHFQELPFQDYYFGTQRLEILDLILNSSLNIPLAKTALPIEQLKARMSHESPDLLPYLSKIGGSDFREVFQTALGIVGQARQAVNSDWIGTKDVWIVDFFPALARSLPHAQFVILHRDPRAMVASMLNIAKSDPSQLGHTLSYARHWRKTVALGEYFQTQELFRNRLYILRYEDLVHDSQSVAQELCDFLSLDFSPRMIDPSQFYDYKHGIVWTGNSSFQAEVRQIDANHTDLWRKTLPETARKLVEFVCEYEMLLMQYSISEPPAPTDPDLLAYILKNHLDSVSWRSDLENPPQDYGYEIFRHMLPHLKTTPDPTLIRQAFLFEHFYSQILSVMQSQIDL